MTRKEFLIKNILAAGYVALKPALNLIPSEPEYFVFIQEELHLYGFAMAMKMVYKGEEYSTDVLFVKSKEEPYYSNALTLMKKHLSVFL